MRYWLIFAFLFEVNLYASEAILSIPLNDKCIDRVYKTKIYIKPDYIQTSKGKTFIETSTYGKVEIKNLNHGKCGYYLLAIIMKRGVEPCSLFTPKKSEVRPRFVPANNSWLMENGAVNPKFMPPFYEKLHGGFPYDLQTCDFNPECQEHLMDAIEHGVCTWGYMAGGVASGYTMNVTGVVVCGIGAVFSLRNTASDLSKAWDSYNRNSAENNNDSSMNKNSESDFMDNQRRENEQNARFGH